MNLEEVRALVTVPNKGLVPAPELFWHSSLLHGQAHVARVLVHAFRLVEATGFNHEMPRLWAAVYLHDIARRHDGRSAGASRRPRPNLPAASRGARDGPVCGAALSGDGRQDPAVT